MSTFPALPMRFDPPSEKRSTAVGIVATVLVHLLLLLVMPRLSLRNDYSGVPSGSAPKSEFNIELAPEQVAPPAPLAPSRFVETNPNAPENTPDDTPNFSNRNQQSAQEKATPDAKGDRP